MSKTMWTQAPWNPTNNKESIIHQNGSTIKTVATIVTANKALAEVEANARLISAAPELYEALENILKAMETDEDAEPEQSWLDNLYRSADAARPALAKARGEP